MFLWHKFHSPTLLCGLDEVGLVTEAVGKDHAATCVDKVKSCFVALVAFGNILLDNNVPIYRLTDENGDAQKFLAVKKEALDNMIRIRDEYLPDADAEALYEVYARHKNGLLSDDDTTDVNRILDRELGEDFRRGMERRTRDASIGRGENFPYSVNVV